MSHRDTDCFPEGQTIPPSFRGGNSFISSLSPGLLRPGRRLGR